ncbi:MAG TPA: PadR family transcriptional regulator [Bellilinea sp.]|nr:PadR family transcriptional regulator [Bellilinea sp.]
MSPRQQAPLSTEYILLGLLAQGPAHGYDLHKQLATLDGLSAIWHVKQSQLYALLDKLEGMGYLQSVSTPGTAYALRKQYHLTESGRQAFDAWLISPVQHAREMRQGFLARLYFARLSSAAAVQQLIDAQYTTCLDWQHDIQPELDATSDLKSFQRVVSLFRLNQINAMLNWLDECRKTLTA